ncbi:MAG: MbtH family NRPS accessory protein [Saprospiraceae bacterium]|nr:MbtH family NRPS accessory protein [Saprospiraceae bacterium]
MKFPKISLTTFLSILFFFGPGSTQVAIGQNPGEKELEYKVVINHEEQYALWLTDKKSPPGWKNTGISGNQKKCQAYIEEVWTDMRPLSIRKMELSANAGYQVVINHEEQYSIWPVELDLPRGWKAVGNKGTLDKCRAYIEEVWTDMRPLSLRKMMAGKK